jgi:hypothetical protein
MDERGAPMRFACLWLCLAFALSAKAHIGSPNVFFEGHAGPYPVRVIIRPPASLPGVANVDVRLNSDGITKVKVEAVFADASATVQPAAVEAQPVADDGSLRTAQIWLLRRGAYTVEVTLDGTEGASTAIIPLDSMATQRPTMPRGLGVVLAALGGVLFAGGIAISGAVAREGTLPWRDKPGAADRWRGRKVSAIAFLMMAVSTGAVALRWKSMDREFQGKALAKPVPVGATCVENGKLHLLRLTRHTTAPHGNWETLATDHGKLMHLFLIEERSHRVFAHLHPVRRSGDTFEGVLPPLPKGEYQLYAELTYESGIAETLVGKVSIPPPLGVPPQTPFEVSKDVWCQPGPVPVGDSGAPLALDSDDSWDFGPAGPNSGRIAPLMGDSRMLLHFPTDFVADEETTLRFSVVSPRGEEVPLQPYMGMTGHAVVRRSDGMVFTHLHPVGTISMAAHAIAANRERAVNADRPPPNAAFDSAPATEVTFPYAFSQAGEYRIWVQVRVEGRVNTGVFDVAVKSKR